MSASRADRLADLVAGRKLDALIVTKAVNVRYLTGFTGTNGACLVGEGVRLFATDFRYVEQAERQVQGFERVQGREDLLGDVVERLSGRVGFEDQEVTVRRHERLREKLPEKVELVPAGGLVEELRAVKERAELEAMRRAAALSDDVYRHLGERGFAGRTEREVAVDLEQEIRRRGGEPAFPTIVAAGANGALPHAAPEETAIGVDTLVVVDLGCLVDGYCSDCTRTFATGPLAAEPAAVYDLVRSTQEEALRAVGGGAECRALDSVAREAISAAGHGERFGHGLGHGVGLEVHEEPRLSQRAEGALVERNAVTVEPGVYVPGAFGVRIEDLVVVTDDGCEILTRFPKDLIVLGA